MEQAEELVGNFIVETVKDWYSYITTYNDNIKHLEDKYNHLDSQKQTLESKVDRRKEDLQRPTKLTDEWLDKGKSLMEDDEELKKLLDKESRIRKDQCCFGRLRCNLRKRYQMSKAAELKAKDIEAVIQEKPDESSITEPLSRSELKPTPTEFLKSLPSRVKLMEDVVKKLRDDQVDVVGIYGMGAIGKTTLVKEIASKDAKGIFQEIVMVEISEAPNTERIQDQIAEQLNMKDLGGVHNTYDRANRLYNRLQKKKKILIILDNVWEKLELRKVGIPQPHENTQEFCCKLLLTSRKKDVCEVMGASAANIFEVHTLNEEEARILFRARVGEKGQDKNIETRLLKKCGGLPLSIVALADVLRDQELSMWEHYAIDLEKPISTHGTIRGVNQATYSILETSYKLMESEKKRRFFMLACLFPLGSSIPIDDMMRYGIGLGLFQHVNSLTEAIQQANTWADELKSSSLLLVGENYSRPDDYYVKIHDVVRASTISLAEKGGDVFMVESFPRWMHQETLQKYSAISLTAGIDHSRLIGLNSEKLKILILDKSPPLLFDATLSPSRMPNLKVLVLKGMRCGLPKSIESFKNSLTTLHLEKCDLGDNAGWIGELVSLVVLSLRGSRTYELPESMRNLCNLRLLDLRDCNIVRKGIPANVLASLSQLEGLYANDTVFKWGRSVHESGAEEGTKQLEEEEEGKTSNDGGGEYRYASIDELNKLNYLNVLEMKVKRLEELPTEGDQLVHNLDQFRVVVGGAGEVSDLNLARLNWSRQLALSELSLSRVMENSWGKALVQKAQVLQLIEMEGLEQYLMQQERGRFEELEFLWIESCDELHECNTCVLPIHLLPPNLTEVDVRWCRRLKFIFGKAENETQDDDNPTPTHYLPFLRTLHLVDLLELESVVEVSRASNSPALFHEKLILEALEELYLDGCNGFASLWGVPYNKVYNLKRIYIFGCGKLKSLGSLSIATALVQLESLEISYCEEIREGMSEDGESQSQSHDEAARLSKSRGRDNNGNNDTLSLFPSLRELKLWSCPKMEKFITTSNQRCVVEFPSLQSLYIRNCHKIQSFSAGHFRAPKLSYFRYDYEDPSMEEMRDINHFLNTRFQRRSSEQ